MQYARVAKRPSDGFITLILGGYLVGIFVFGVVLTKVFEFTGIITVCEENCHAVEATPPSAP